MSFVTVSSSNRRPIRRLERSALDSHTTSTQKDSLDVEDGVLGVHGSLVLGRLADETLLAGERDERGSGEATLLVGNCRHTLLDGRLRSRRRGGAY
jgi:hypothetical protein